MTGSCETPVTCGFVVKSDRTGVAEKARIFPVLKMFHKPFRVKTQTAIKGSDRKKLRASLSSCFADLTQDQLNDIIPNKDDMTITKAYTHSGETTVIYSVNKVPVVFEMDRRLYPTVYTLWRYPTLLPNFTTYGEVVKKLAGGADLMLPGVVIKGDVTPSTFKHIEKGDACSINIFGNLAAVAVGKTMMSGSDMFDSGMKGKGVHVIHLMGDELWSFGDKSKLPEIPDPLAIAIRSEESADGAGDTSDKQTDSTDTCQGASNDVMDSETNGNQDHSLHTDMENLQLEKQEGNEDDASDDEEEKPVVMTAEDMDDLLVTCFKCAIKSSMKKSDLPLLTSAFYKLHMLPFCPQEKFLDVKKSSYKKLSKFLKEMQKQGLITVKELSKGADSITGFDKTHSSLRDFTPLEMREVDEQPTASDGATGGPTNYEPPKITEKFSVTAVLLPLLKPFGYSKSSALSGHEIRTVISDYVKANNLQKEDDRRLVQIDPLLGDIVLSRDEGNTLYLQWENLYSRVIAKAHPAYTIGFSGQPEVLHKGKLEGIHITVTQRASNKKVTLVDNLETFGIEPGDFAHYVQKALSCSSSVIPVPQKGKGMQALIQGNQMKYVADLLVDGYRVPKKYVLGMDKVKSGNKKR